MATSIGR
jgi:hypothetical protein